MELSKQVCSLELAKRLKELGVKQDSFLTWCQSTECGNYKDGEYKLVPFNEFYGSVHDYYCAGRDNKDHEMYAAFTVAELGEMLPREIHVPYKGKMGIAGKVRKDGQYFHAFGAGKDEKRNINYTGGTSRERLTQSADTEADARAKMLIYLLENKLIKE